MKRLLLAATLLSAPAAHADSILDTYPTSTHGGAPTVPSMVMLCVSTDGSNTAVVCPAATPGTSNTVAPTTAGTSGTQANGVQGVTGGVPLTVLGGSAPYTDFSVTIPANSALQIIPCAGCNALPSSGSNIPNMVAGAEIWGCSAAVNLAVAATGTLATASYPVMGANLSYGFNPPVPITQAVSMWNNNSSAVTCTGKVK